MKNTRITLVALTLLATALMPGKALFADDGIEVLAGDGIEVLRNDGIEVLGIEVLGSDGIEVLGIEVLANDGIEVLANDGIEVLGIEVLDVGTTYALRIQNAPAGSYVQAESSPNGADVILVDAAPVDPVTGEATITFPANIPGNRITVHAPDGSVISSSGYIEGIDFD